MRKGAVGFPEMLEIRAVVNIFRIAEFVDGRKQGLFIIRRRQIFYFL